MEQCPDKEECGSISVVKMNSELWECRDCGETWPIEQSTKGEKIGKSTQKN